MRLGSPRRLSSSTAFSSIRPVVPLTSVLPIRAESIDRMIPGKRRSSTSSAPLYFSISSGLGSHDFRRSRILSKRLQAELGRVESTAEWLIRRVPVSWENGRCRKGIESCTRRASTASAALRQIATARLFAPNKLESRLRVVLRRSISEDLQPSFFRPDERDAISVVRAEYRAAMLLVVNGFKR